MTLSAITPCLSVMHIMALSSRTLSSMTLSSMTDRLVGPHDSLQPTQLAAHRVIKTHSPMQQTFRTPSHKYRRCSHTSFGSVLSSRCFVESQGCDHEEQPTGENFLDGPAVPPQNCCETGHQELVAPTERLLQIHVTMEGQGQKRHSQENWIWDGMASLT